MKLEGEKRGHTRPIAIGLILLGVFIAWQQFGPDIDVEKLLEDLSEKLGDFTYVLVGLLAFLETGAFVGLVFPGETAVILGGAVAGQGETSLVITIGVVWFCAWAGDSVSFLIGSRLGRGFVLRHGPKVRITAERFEQVEGYFERHGGKTILIGRFIGLVRALAPFIAGSSGMTYRAFVPFSILGTGLWAGAFTVLGYVVSESISQATAIAGRGIFVFGALVALIVAFLAARRFLRVPENRRRLVARIEANRLGRPLVALGRRIQPQARFLWNRVTPGGLGLELTSLLAALSVALFALVGYWSIVDEDPGPSAGDSEAFDVTADLQSDWLTDVAEVVTTLGSAPFVIAVAIVAGAALAFRRRWPELCVLVAAVALAQFAVPALKEIVDRPRPGGGLVEARGDSFPSGHAAYSVLYIWVALTITARVRPGIAHASALIAIAIALTAAIGLSRVYLHVHYMSDVSAGWGLGVSLFAACAIVALIVTHLRNNHAG